jgi:hypothetical protein
VNDNIFSTDKNLVIAVNELTRNIRMITGSKHSENIEPATTVLLESGHGYVVAAFVTVAGTTPGEIYDTKKKATIAPDTMIGLIPNVVGRYEIGAPYFEGLLLKTGTGQNVTLIYS